MRQYLFLVTMDQGMVALLPVIVNLASIIGFGTDISERNELTYGSANAIHCYAAPDYIVQFNIITYNIIYVTFCNAIQSYTNTTHRNSIDTN